MVETGFHNPLDITTVVAHWKLVMFYIIYVCAN